MIKIENRLFFTLSILMSIVVVISNYLVQFPVKYLGHITSSYHSPTLNHYVAMAMIEGGNDLIGKKFYVTQNQSSENISVEIVKPVFLDPENKRLLS